jgi:hypothetical protein
MSKLSIILLIISAITLVIPDLWHGTDEHRKIKTILGISMILFIASICTFIYTYCYYDHLLAEISYDWLKPIGLVGILYTISTITYVHARENNSHLHLFSIQTLLTFIISEIIAFKMYNEGATQGKIIGIIITIIGVITMIYMCN